MARKLFGFLGNKTSTVDTVGLHSGDMVRARALQKKGHLLEAASLYAFILTIEPGHWDACNALAEMALQNGHTDQALHWYDAYISRQVGHAPALAHYKRANALNRIGRWQEALRDYDRALELEPKYAKALCNRGAVLEQLGRFGEAVHSLDLALEVDPADHLAWYNRGSVLMRMGRSEPSLDSYNHALALKPDFFAALVNRGNVFQSLGNSLQALHSFEIALGIQTDTAAAHIGRGQALKELTRFREAIESYNAGLQLDPARADAFAGLGFCMLGLGLIDNAIAAYDRSLELDPDGKYVLGMRRHAHMHMCSWDGIADDCERIAASVRAGRPVVLPFTLLSLIDSAPLQRIAAATWVREECPADDSLGFVARRARAAKINIGYFSADFRAHPVAMLTAELFETHDRRKFNITAFAFGPDADDSVRDRLRPAFDRFIDVRNLSDREVALLARDLRIDIAVDLGGYTNFSRTKIFAQRAAPIQLSYIGYLGTLAAPYMDYLLADATLIPSVHRGGYAEKIIYLPSYQANDSCRPHPDPRFSRAVLGLPATGFVYCCFNANYKITPATFDRWMSILKRVPGSSLFLYVDNRMAQSNLKREAARRGVDEERIVFAERLPFDAYLARLHAMDLFLDTSPYNAGTTASDALWLGLPVLTFVGQAFAGRMAASLLTALGLPELIALTPAEYEETAVSLAVDDARMASIKSKLATARRATLLFNTPAFVRSLEDAYQQVYERHHANLAPDDICVRQRDAGIEPDV